MASASEPERGGRGGKHGKSAHSKKAQSGSGTLPTTTCEVSERAGPSKKPKVEEWEKALAAMPPKYLKERRKVVAGRLKQFQDLFRNLQKEMVAIDGAMAAQMSGKTSKKQNP